MIQLLFISLAFAYQPVFEQDTVSGIREVAKKRAYNQRLQSKCDLEKARGGFLWSCYLVSGAEMSATEVSQDCKIKVGKVRSEHGLPSLKETEQLPKDCRELIKHRRQILAYKAKGI